MDYCEKIKKIIANKEREKIKLELKSYRPLSENKVRGEFLNKLAYEIVALANTWGGSLILGVNDDGRLDGKFTGNVDDVKRDVINICRDKINPVVDCEIEFIECNEADVFNIIIPQRKSIPHAYTPNKEAGAIKNRVYYIRTSHGKKLVNDVELEWMFKNLGFPNVSRRFNVVFEFDKNLTYRTKYFPHGGYYVNGFLNLLSKEDKEMISSNNRDLASFILELFPYLMLSTLSIFYSTSWNMEIDTLFNRTTYPIRSIPTPEEENIIKISDIPIEGGQIINKLKWNLNSVIKGNGLNDNIHLPPNVVLTIKRETNSIIIRLKNSYIEIKIILSALSYGGGLSQHNPDYQVLLERHGAKVQNEAMSDWLFFDGGCLIDVNFDYPEDNIAEYKDVFNYCNVLIDFITHNWSYDKVLEKIPSIDFRIMNQNIIDIMRHLKI